MEDLQGVSRKCRNSGDDLTDNLLVSQMMQDRKVRISGQQVIGVLRCLLNRERLEKTEFLHLVAESDIYLWMKRTYVLIRKFERDNRYGPKLLRSRQRDV